MKKNTLTLCCLIYLIILKSQPNQIIYIEQTKTNKTEGYIFYKHHLTIDTFKYIVSYPLVSIFDFKFNIDSTI